MIVMGTQLKKDFVAGNVLESANAQDIQLALHALSSEVTSPRFSEATSYQKNVHK